MKKWNLIVTIPPLILGILIFVACTSSEKINHIGEPETGTFADPRDGNIYKTVKIGDQWIMAENLAYKPDKGNFWAYENNDSNIAIYGYLYDWETAMNIAPEGWHLPSKKEWINLRKAIGGKFGTIPYLEKIYPKMIVGGSSGLEMLFGGMRACNGVFQYLGNMARFWISDNTGSEKYVFGLDRNEAIITSPLRNDTVPYAFYNQYQKSCRGFSVRLFKD